MFDNESDIMEKIAWLENIVKVESPATKRLTERIVRRSVRSEVKKIEGDDEAPAPAPAGTVTHEVKISSPADLPSGHAEIIAAPETKLVTASLLNKYARYKDAVF